MKTNSRLREPQVPLRRRPAGETWNWRGDTSRDQYTGVMLGHLEAYRATRDEDVRALLREDVVGLLEALMLVPENVPVHISIDGFEMDYAWAELEADPARAADLAGGLLDDRMWATVQDHKNAYFAFLWAATQGPPDADAVEGAVDQLSQFQPGPRVHVGRDNRDRYPADGACNDQVDHGTAVDVGDRVVSEFLWQRNPWVMFEPGDPRTVEPGVDYLAAYWLARRHGLLPDDRSGTCARWDGR